jgi:hypothetical protein
VGSIYFQAYEIPPAIDLRIIAKTLPLLLQQIRPLKNPSKVYPGREQSSDLALSKKPLIPLIPPLYGRQAYPLLYLTGRYPTKSCLSFMKLPSAITQKSDY